MGMQNESFYSVKRLTTVITVLLAVLATGCASTRNVPFNIQSDPLGAYVVFQIGNDAGAAQSDWVYLGNTPLVTTREYASNQLKRGNSIKIRVMKEGYFDQTKAWKGDELKAESRSEGRIFWNPRLVPSS